MKPTIGRIVHYTLDAHDATAINRRREDGSRNLPVHAAAADGSVIHVGNHVIAGDVYPAMIVRTWGDGGDVQLQVFLDGNDTYWATSVSEGVGHRRWSWPPRIA